MRRSIAAIIVTTTLLILPSCGSGTSNPAAQAARPLTIDGVDLALTRQGLPLSDVTGEYIDNEAYAQRITAIGAARAVYFRIGGDGQTPVTIIEFDPRAKKSIEAYIAGQRAKLGIADDPQAATADGALDSPTELISSLGESVGPQWRIQSKRNIVIIGDASSKAWRAAVATLERM